MAGQKFVQFIADYGVGDPAFGEVIQKIIGMEPMAEVNRTSVPAFSTIATGFWTAQFSLVNPLPGMVVYTNTAPRKDNKDSREKNEGERLIYAKLKNGVDIVGVNAGYCFSFIKPHIEKVHIANVANKGSQFRSRDFYPEAVVSVLQGKTDLIGEAFDVDFIPDLPKNRIAWIDGYGNMKTSTRASEVKDCEPGQPLVVILNGMKRTAFFTDGSFSVREGELAFSPGSSGGDDPFMELFLRGLSAHMEFGKPDIEAEFSYKPVA